MIENVFKWLLGLVVSSMLLMFVSLTAVAWWGAMLREIAKW